MTAEQDFLGKGIKFPLEVSKTSGQLSTSSGENLIRESILIILRTMKGERVMRPDFGCGLQELVFAPNDTSTATLVAFYVKEALLKWEPRIEVLAVNAFPDKEAGNQLNITIDYNIKATNTKKNLVYPFYLEVTR